MTKFVSVNRNDGFTWLAVDILGKRIFLYRQGRTGNCQPWSGERANPADELAAELEAPVKDLARIAHLRRKISG